MENVTIHNGTISAVAGKGGAAIGAGEGFNSGISRVDSIDIDGGTISRAAGGSSGAGIGAGLTNIKRNIYSGRYPHYRRNNKCGRW